MPPLVTAIETTVASTSFGPVLGTSLFDGPVEATEDGPVDGVEEVLFVELVLVLVDDVWPPAFALFDD